MVKMYYDSQDPEFILRKYHKYSGVVEVSNYFAEAEGRRE